MNRLLKATLCISIFFSGVFAACVLTPYPARAVQTIYGAVYGWKYVTTAEAIYLEVTTSPVSTPASVNYNVTYKMKCMDGRSSVVNASPNTGNQNPGLGFTPGGGFLVRAFVFNMQSQTNGTFGGYGENFPCEGWLISALLTHDSGSNSAVRGLAYQQVQVMSALPNTQANSGQISGTQFNGYIEAYLLCGNVPGNYGFSWPEHGCDGPDVGLQLNMDSAGGNAQGTLPNPAAITNFTYTPAGGYRYKIINISYTLATDANAGNRFACVVLVSGGVIVAGPYCSPYPQQLSQTVTYEFAAGVGWATNCSLLGGTQTAVQCASVEVPLPTFLEISPGFDGISVQSCVTTGNVANTLANCASGFKTTDQISVIHIRQQVTHETS